MQLDPITWAFITLTLAALAAFLYQCHRWLPVKFMGWRGADTIALPGTGPGADSSCHVGGDAGAGH